MKELLSVSKYIKSITFTPEQIDLPLFIPDIDNTKNRVRQVE